MTKTPHPELPALMTREYLIDGLRLIADNNIHARPFIEAALAHLAPPDGALPALPAPTFTRTNMDVRPHHTEGLYTADQMRQYARDAIAALTPDASGAVAWRAIEIADGWQSHWMDLESWGHEDVQAFHNAGKYRVEYAYAFTHPAPVAHAAIASQAQGEVATVPDESMRDAIAILCEVTEDEGAITDDMRMDHLCSVVQRIAALSRPQQ